MSRLNHIASLFFSLVFPSNFFFSSFVWRHSIHIGFLISMIQSEMTHADCSLTWYSRRIRNTFFFFPFFIIIIIFFSSSGYRCWNDFLFLSAIFDFDWHFLKLFCIYFSLWLNCNPIYESCPRAFFFEFPKTK